MKKLKDNFGRVHNYLRVSVTDKCNLNCLYCNPADAIQSKLKRNEILSYSEILRVIKIFISEFGFRKIRITGGEPFARKDIMNFFYELSLFKKDHPFDLGITTNGTFLKDKTSVLKEYGIDNLNISLDSLNKEKFNKITGKDQFDEVTSAIRNAVNDGLRIKINTVVMRGVNDDELIDFISFAKEGNLNIRFIEYMPFTANAWNTDAFISYSEMKERIEKVFPLQSLPNSGGTTKDYSINGSGCKISFISSVSEHFCDSCNRLRITSEGKMKLCLFSLPDGIVDLKELMRNNSDDGELISLIENKLSDKKYKHPEAEELALYEKNFMKGIGG